LKEVSENKDFNVEELGIQNNEIETANMTLKYRKAPGPDCIKSEIFKSMKDIWVP